MRWPVVLVLAVVALFLGAWLLREQQAGGGEQTVIGARRGFVAVDSSGNGHDGVVVGSPHVGLPGRFGQSYGFGPDGSWVLVPPGRELNPGGNDFMVSAWVKLLRVPGPGTSFDVVRKGLSYTPGGGFKLEIVSGPRVRCAVTDSRRRKERVEKVVPEIADGNWHHLACARTGPYFTLVVDDMIESVPVQLGRIDNSMPLALGSKYGDEDQVQGRIDEATLWVSDDATPPDAPIVPAEAMQQLRGQHPVARWHLDETT